MQDSAFLSVRIPEPTRDRLKAAAAARGESVQKLVGTLLEQFLAENDRAAPVLGAIISKLRAHADALRQRGVVGLWVFGSVARGDAHFDSDIDLLVDLDPNAHLSLVRFSSLRAELSDLLGASADLVERSTLREAVREAAEREAIRVL